MEDYIQINKNSWDQRVEPHVNSDFYEMNAFLSGKNSLKSIELALLGEVQGKRILHLQCHFGQDSLSLSRMGAHVTGVDFSSKAIQKANELKSELNVDATFIACDLYDLPEHLEGQFDIIFTSYGTIGWLPDLDKWASVITHFLSPNGRFIFVEFHPFIWTFDDSMEKIEFHYFNNENIIEEIKGTYADRNAPVILKTITWNHSLSEVFGALMHQGIHLIDFQEYDYSPYNCLFNLTETKPGEFRFKHIQPSIPMLYSLVGKKN